MNSHKQKQREKDILATVRQLYELEDLRYKTGWEDCKPFQHGWWREWTLREDVAKRPDAKNLWKIRKHVAATRQWCRTKDFVVSKSRKTRVEMDPPPIYPIRLSVDPWTGEQTGWPIELPEEFKAKYFYYHPVNSPHCNCYKKAYYRPAHYSFKTPWMFELRIRPTIITRVPITLGEIDSQIKRLSEYMQFKQYWPAYRRLRGFKSDWRKDNRDKLIIKELDKQEYNHSYELSFDLDS